MTKPNLKAPDAPLDGFNVNQIALKGQWQAETVSLWHRDAIDLVEPGLIALTGEEGDQRSGRGRGILKSNGSPAGRVFLQ